MKNSILKTAIASALVLSAFADTATAATIYDKDGTTLSINGRIRARGSNGMYYKYLEMGQVVWQRPASDNTLAKS